MKIRLMLPVFMTAIALGISGVYAADMPAQPASGGTPAASSQAPAASSPAKPAATKTAKKKHTAKKSAAKSSAAKTEGAAPAAK